MVQPQQLTRRETQEMQAATPRIDLTSSERFINRELSWLEFNMRVLAEANNTANPLLERARFLSISASNLDEFYMVRAAGLTGQVAADITERSQDGMSPLEQLNAIREKVSELLDGQDDCLAKLLAECKASGLEVADAAALNAEDHDWLVSTGLYPGSISKFSRSSHRLRSIPPIRSRLSKMAVWSSRSNCGARWMRRK